MIGLHHNARHWLIYIYNSYMASEASSLLALDEYMIVPCTRKSWFSVNYSYRNTKHIHFCTISWFNYVYNTLVIGLVFRLPYKWPYIYTYRCFISLHAALQHECFFFKYVHTSLLQYLPILLMAVKDIWTTMRSNDWPSEIRIYQLPLRWLGSQLHIM